MCWLVRQYNKRATFEPLKSGIHKCFFLSRVGSRKRWFARVLCAGMLSDGNVKRIFLWRSAGVKREREFDCASQTPRSFVRFEKCRRIDSRATRGDTVIKRRIKTKGCGTIIVRQWWARILSCVHFHFDEWFLKTIEYF